MSYFDRIEIGLRRHLGSYTFEEADIVQFARRFDPQRFHLSQAGAADTHFKRLCASGWHTGSVWMKLNTRLWQKEIAAFVAAGNPPPRIGPSPGFENLRWIKPVYCGDTITYYGTFAAKRPLKSRPGWAMLSTINEGVNQDGDLVLQFEGHVMIGL